MKLFVSSAEASSDTIKAAAALAALGLLAALVSSQLRKEIDGKKVKPHNVPSTTLPVLGNLLDVAKHQEHFYDWLTQVSESFDNQPWVLTIPGRSKSLVISSLTHFEEVMKTKDNVFLRGPEGQYISHDMFGNGIAIADGDAWFFHRKTASNMFSMQMMKDVMQEVVREKLAVLLGGIRDYVAQGKQVSLVRELGHFTMDVFSKIGFGVEQHTMENGFADQNGSSKFNDAFKLASATFGERIETPMFLWRFKRFLNIGSERIFKQNMDIINGLVFDVINKSMEMKRNNDTAGLAMRKDLVSLFVDRKVVDDDTRLEEDDATIMRDMVFNFIFAGKDSSAQAMTWIIVNLNRHLHVLAKIRQEMREKVPELLSQEVEVPTVAQVNDLVYLEAAIRESLRLYPSTGFIFRQAMEDTVLRDGTFVEKDMTVMIASWPNARNKTSWGEDADKYIPERWIDSESGKLLAISPFKFSSFGSGQHICIGRQFALMEMKLAMATLLSKFDIKTVEKPQDITYGFALTIPVKGQLFCDVKPVGSLFPAAA